MQALKEEKILKKFTNKYFQIVNTKKRMHHLHLQSAHFIY